MCFSSREIWSLKQLEDRCPRSWIKTTIVTTNPWLFEREKVTRSLSQGTISILQVSVCLKDCPYGFNTRHKLALLLFSYSVRVWKDQFLFVCFPIYYWLLLVCCLFISDFSPFLGGGKEVGSEWQTKQGNLWFVEQNWIQELPSAQRMARRGFSLPLGQKIPTSWRIHSGRRL